MQEFLLRLSRAASAKAFTDGGQFAAWLEI